MKSVLLLCAAYFGFTVAEPPIDNRYLPPQQKPQPFAQDYGTSRGHEVGSRVQTQTNAVFGRQQFFNDNAPSFNQQPPSSQLGSPSTLGSTDSSSHYNSNSRIQASQFNPSQYVSPSSTINKSEQNEYEGRNSFSTLNAGYSVPNQQPDKPSTQYGVPDYSESRGGSDKNAPRQGYDRPSSNKYRPMDQSTQYLPPGYGTGANENNGESANYSFEYMVKDDVSGNDFGHRESRQGDRVEGLYYVLLPDGRKQTVEYQADQDGYKPKISYEDTGRIVANGVFNGYNDNAPKFGGYDGNAQSSERYNGGY